MLSYEDGVEFCRRATEAMRVAKLITTQQVIRLPSEAEWEYAARAGSSTRYSFGDASEMLGDYAWFTGNAAGNDPAVGAKRPNAWQLYDMHGYLWEWCADAWHDNYEVLDRRLRLDLRDRPRNMCSAAAVGKIRPTDSRVAPVVAPPLILKMTRWACAACWQMFRRSGDLSEPSSCSIT